MLLDTNVVFWLLSGEPRLGHVARSRIASASVAFFSAVTITELRIKQLKGKLQVPDGLLAHLAAAGLAPLALAPEHADALLTFPQLASHDPFDRMLLAQAQVERLNFLTSDRVLLGLELPWIIDATR